MANHGAVRLFESLDKSRYTLRVPQTITAESPHSTRSRTAIHPVSALILIVIDNLWTLGDWAAALWVVTIPLSFLAVCVPTFFVQKFLHGDNAGKSLALAMFLGILAAVPTPIAGTTAGVIVLGLAGLNLRRTPSAS